MNVDVKIEKIAIELGCDEGLVREIARRFQTSGVELLSAVIKALSDENLQKVAESLHSLRGEVGIFCAWDLVKLCSEMENEARNGEGDSVKKRLDSLTKGVDSLLRCLDPQQGRSTI